MKKKNIFYNLKILFELLGFIYNLLYLPKRVDSIFNYLFDKSANDPHIFMFYDNNILICKDI